VHTKTISWRLLAGLFSISVWWSLVIPGGVGVAVGRVGRVRSDGAGMVLAGMTEKSLKLGPAGGLARARGMRKSRHPL
jgi:hypothetical protein